MSKILSTIKVRGRGGATFGGVALTVSLMSWASAVPLSAVTYAMGNAVVNYAEGGNISEVSMSGAGLYFGYGAMLHNEEVVIHRAVDTLRDGAVTSEADVSSGDETIRNETVSDDVAINDQNAVKIDMSSVDPYWAIHMGYSEVQVAGGGNPFSGYRTKLYGGTVWGPNCGSTGKATCIAKVVPELMYRPVVYRFLPMTRRGHPAL